MQNNFKTYRQRGKPNDPCNRAIEEQQQSLSEAIRVNKLRNNELHVYFRGMQTSTESLRQELARRSQHYEDFKKAFNKKVPQDSPAGIIHPNDMNLFLKRYELRNIDKEACKAVEPYKPAMRRTPLRSIKMVNIELPGPHATDAVYVLPKTVTFPAVAEKSSTQSFEVVCTDSEHDAAQSMIEKQLEQTKQEITVASSQLEKIRAILNKRKSELEPVTEEEAEEQPEETSVIVKTTVDRQCSAINHPKTQWTVKSVNTDPVRSKNKNRLVSTLNNLNLRLQRIQEKYFTEPRIKYKSISDFTLPKDKKTALELIYKNSKYSENLPEQPATVQVKNVPVDNLKTNSHLDRLLKIVPDLKLRPEVSPETSSYLENINRRVDEGLHTFDFCSLDKQPPETDLKVLLSPKYDYEEPQIVEIANNAQQCDATDQPRKESRSILKKEPPPPQCDTVLEAPALQESIFKSDYLRKEFNIHSKDLEFDIAKLLLKESSNKKNVRFVKTAHPSKAGSEASKRTRKTLPRSDTMEFALKNTLYDPQ